MYAIDTAGSVAGKFTEGNPAIGQRATKVGADWLNDVQANLLAVLLEGGIDPTKGRAADLTDAIKAIIAGVVGTGDGVPTDRTITGGGLATVNGNGDLTANRVISVAKASAVEIAAGIEDGKAITPAALAAAFGGDGLIGNGYAKLPGGMIVQWGSVRGSYTQGSTYKAFPTAFPHACFSVAITVANTSGSDVRDLWPQIVSRTNAGFTTYLQRGGGDSNAADGFDFIAIGY